MRKRRKKTKKQTTNSKSKIVDPILQKARSLRSSLLRRAKTEEDKLSTPIVKELEKWLRRNSYICYYSLEPLEFSEITVDHKLPIQRGGSNLLSNLCICSRVMNNAKGTMSEEEFRSLLELIKTWEDGGESLLKRLRQGLFG